MDIDLSLEAENIIPGYKTGRLHHAILFIGDEDECSSQIEHTARKFQGEYSPYDTVFAKEMMPDNTYKIAPLREVIVLGDLLPQFCKARVFVFTDFNEMSEVCQNALLKFIEEPKGHNRFIMTARETKGILTTIISRVITVNLGNMEPQKNIETNELKELAAEIVLNLGKLDEYKVYCLFNKINNREMLEAVLHLLLDEFSKITLTTKKPNKTIMIIEILEKYINRMGTNPNVPITIASCTGELFKVL